jgi:hypothetical protein
MIELRGHFDGRVIVPDEPVELPRDRALIVRVEPVPQSADAPAPGGSSFLEWSTGRLIDDPTLPADLSDQLDHHLYGTPKRED